MEPQLAASPPRSRPVARSKSAPREKKALLLAGYLHDGSGQGCETAGSVDGATRTPPDAAEYRARLNTLSQANRHTRHRDQRILQVAL
jgi:hypothetical protein